ncbi:MAG: ABATE domain-containing protein [Blastocatellia bacterium]
MDLLCLDFMNSDVRDALGSGLRTDRLRDAEWVARFLARWKLGEHNPPARASLTMLIELRAAMWSIVSAMVEGNELSDDDLATIDGALGGPSLFRLLVRDGGSFRVELEPTKRDWVWVASEIVASLADVLAAHETHRLKLCGNPDCRWVFYDESKNRTRRWCADSCGNLIKVRRFRKARR